MLRKKYKSILIATQDQTVSETIGDCLLPLYKVAYAADKKQCLELFKRNRYEFTFIDVGLLTEGLADKADQQYFKNELSVFWKTYPTASIIIICSQDKVHEGVYAVKAGASNYLACPTNPDEIKFVLENICEDKRKQSELDYLRDQFWEIGSLDIVKTNSLLMREVFNKVRSVAPTRTTVMLYGETGTGKGVVARLLHIHSNRKSNRFISLHCGAIPDTLLESELFGHEKGAFTGAVKRKLGKFEIAHGGTIFLDEIGTISSAAQIKMLQILQDRTYQRVGGEEILETNVRIVAATNADLKTMAEAGDFRKDLFYRLNVFPIEIPALNERKEDMPLLVDSILKRLNIFYAKGIDSVHPLVMEAFQSYTWPGNIRELENLIERSYILEKSSVLSPESFPSELFIHDAATAQIYFKPSQTLSEIRRRGIEIIERQYLKELLTWNNGRIDHSAEDAGVSTRQLHKLLAKYGIRKEDYK